MHKTIISDTSCLILFDKIEELPLLQKVYGSLVTTPQIAMEFGAPLPEWIEIISVQDAKYLRFLETQVDPGKASAIALAQELPNVLLLLDDLKARKLATKMNIKFTGSLGILHRAKAEGHIEKIKPMINKIQDTNFRISDKIVSELLRINNE